MMTLTEQTRKVPRFGARYILEARIRGMLKFVWIIIAVTILNPLLYLVSIGVGVGSLISHNIGPHGIDGVSYLTFIAPALLAASAIQSAQDEVIFPTFQGFKWSRIFYGMNATPQTGSSIAGGVFLAAMLRTVFGVAIYSTILYFFGAMNAPHSYLAIPIAIFSGAAFGAVMLAFAAYTENEDKFFTIVGRFIVGPMFLFSGTFFPHNSMPLVVRVFGWVSPLWHSIELGRYATYGHRISMTMVIVHFSFLLAMLIFGLFFAFRQYSHRLEK
jgi:lipooligosaccharide transport system permease protein